MKNIRFHHLILLLTGIALLSACNTTRNVQENEYLLKKNVISIHRDKNAKKDTRFSTDDLYNLLQQQPNDKMLGLFKFGLWVNSATSKGKETKFKGWLNRNLGQEPVILQGNMVERSEDQMKLFLENAGYFNANIETDIIKKKKKATVEYNVTLSQPYRVNDIEYEIFDPAIRNIVLRNTDESLVKIDDIYSATYLDDERYRITSLLRNEGYYFFAPELIYYEVDSAFNNHTLKIFTNIQPGGAPGDSIAAGTPDRNFRTYHLNRISVDPDFNPIKTDTSRMKVISDTSGIEGIGKFNIYYRDKLKIRPKVLRRSVFLEPSMLYREKDEKRTYRQLSGFPLFAFTSLNFRERPEVKDPADTTINFIDCFIELTRRPTQSFSIEAEGTTSGSLLGVAGNFIYRNLNIFRGGEVLSVKLTGGVEWQAGGSNNDPVVLFFNTVQTGAEASIDFPKFLLPFGSDKTFGTLRPRTTIKTGVNYQNRPDYERYVTNGSFGYNWLSNQYVSHSLIPVEINSVSIFPDSSFLKRLENLNDQRLLNQYTDHFLMSAKYTYIYNNQERNKIQNFTFFRWNIETSGNVLSLASDVFSAPKNEDGQSMVWNIPFAQYARTDIDFRYYFALKKDHTLVYRNLVGVGVPYGNSQVLPFEKGFYAGGSNDMRGWNYRSLGPGSFQDTYQDNFEKMGDLILEANLEYRFPVYKWFKGAVFTDIGNIWLLYASSNFPGSKFEFKDFYKEFAVDAGLGLRLDLTFFIFRIDAATPFRDPAYPAGNRWQFNNLGFRNIIWNFGIGYPF